MNRHTRMFFRNPLERIIARVRRTTPALSMQIELEKSYPDLRVISKLGEGGYGTVFEVLDCDQRRLAMKMQARRGKAPSALQKEFEFYRAALAQNGSTTIPAGIPLVYEYREQNGYDFMTMERLGESLRDIMRKSPEMKLRKADVLMIGIQVVHGLRDLHERGILHRDMKPSNLVMGHGTNKERTVYIIDFGLSLFVKDFSKCDYKADVEFAGTRNYAPVEALYYTTPSRMGDLESLAYTLLKLACGSLPWTFINPETGSEIKNLELGDQRFDFTPGELCKDFPELTEFVTAIIRTKRPLKPDYERLVNLLEAALEMIGSKNDGNFSWLKAETEIKSYSSAYDHSRKNVTRNRSRRCLSSQRRERHGVCLDASENFESAATCNPTASSNPARFSPSFGSSCMVEPQIHPSYRAKDETKAEQKQTDNQDTVQRGSEEKESSQDSVQIRKNTVPPTTCERTATYQRARSIVNGADNAHCADLHSRNRGSRMEGEACNDRPQNIETKGGRKRTAMKKLWSKGIGRFSRSDKNWPSCEK